MNVITKICLFCALWFLSNLALAEDSVAITPQQLQNLGITLGKIHTTGDIPQASVPATVVVPPDREFIVGSTQPGLVSLLHAAVGETLVQGQPLARIKSPAFIALQKQFLDAHKQHSYYRSVYQRDKRLWEQGIIAERRWLDTRRQYSEAVNAENEGRQLLAIAGMSDKAVERLRRSGRLQPELLIQSPVSGVVLERMTVAGAQISAPSPLYRIASLEQLWLEMHVPQERIDAIQPGDRVSIDNGSITATITLLGKNVNVETQSVLVRAVIDAEQPPLRVGQTVDSTILHSTDQRLFKLPLAAIARHEGLAYVFLRTPQGFLVKPVQVIVDEAAHAIVSGDLDASREVFAIDGAVALKAIWLGLGEEEGEE